MMKSFVLLRTCQAAPTDKRGVERLLGTVNYLGKFIPNLASVTEPIGVLLRKDIEFQ